MKCEKCSVALAPEARFCPSCGAPAPIPVTSKGGSRKVGLCGVFFVLVVIGMIVKAVQKEGHLTAARSAMTSGDWTAARREAQAVPDSAEARTIVERADAEIRLVDAQQHVQAGRWAEAHGTLTPEVVRVLTPHHSDLPGIVTNVAAKYTEQLAARVSAARESGDLDALLGALVAAHGVRADPAMAVEITQTRVRLAQRAADAGTWDEALRQLAQVPDEAAEATALRERATRELVGPLLDRARQTVGAGSAADAVAAMASLTEVARRYPVVARPHDTEIQELAGRAAELDRRAQDELAWSRRLAREERTQPMTTDVAALAVGLAENNPIQAFAELRRREWTPLQRENFLKSDEGLQALRRIEQLKPQIFAPEKLYVLTIQEKFPTYNMAENCFYLDLETLEPKLTTRTNPSEYGNVYFVGPPVFVRHTIHVGDVGSTQMRALRLAVPKEIATQLEQSTAHAAQVVFTLQPKATDERVTGRPIFVRVISREHVGRLPRDLDGFRSAHVWVSNDLE